MAFLKVALTKEPLVKLWDRKAQKSGPRHTVYSVNGDQYTGEWIDNQKHGKGTQVWRKSGMFYDGEWKYGKRDGFGTLSLTDPVTKQYVKVYEGSWQNDKKEGSGTYFYSTCASYEGQWSEDQRSGWGRMQEDNGELYEGQWLKDKYHGWGLLQQANGNYFVGTWSNGQKHGHGKFFYIDRGQLYEGFWVDGVAKCGTLSDCGREAAVRPTVYPIPRVCLQDPEAVLMEAEAHFTDEDKDKSTQNPVSRRTVARQYVPSA